MAVSSRAQVVLCIVGAVVVAVLGARHLAGGAPDAAPPAAPAASAPALQVESPREERVLVHVAGAVRRPGVYRLPASARVDHAVTRAGGATRRANLDGLNLAAVVEDGRQVLVPERVTAPPRAGVAGPADVSAGTGATGEAVAPGQPINLNTATLEQLDVLPGIGPALAQRIIDHRESAGGFGTVEELADVPGIGDIRMASLRELVSV